MLVNRSLVNNIKHLMSGPEGNSEFCFLRISMFPKTESRETLRFALIMCNSDQHFAGNSELFPL